MDFLPLRCNVFINRKKYSLNVTYKGKHHSFIQHMITENLLSVRYRSDHCGCIIASKQCRLKCPTSWKERRKERRGEGREGKRKKQRKKQRLNKYVLLTKRKHNLLFHRYYTMFSSAQILLPSSLHYHIKIFYRCRSKYKYKN